ncbi:hypothetical protein F5Y16DRAFT_368369 [Xylariaceae sp. FL0255]|nr:hypothetical protein F5Y16DRAFT_368369 [Xylariaceae sp. FL0255]
METTFGIWRDSWAYIAVLELLALFASFIVGLRFWSRRISGLGIHADDWLALVTVLIQHGLNAVILIAFLAEGLGMRPLDIAATYPDSDCASLEKLTLAGTLLYGLSSTTIRLAVIILYFRLFPTEMVKIGGYLLAVVCILWFCAVEIFTLTTCRPAAYLWDKTIPGGQCLDLASATAATITIVASNVAIDAFTVSLPIREIMKLRLSRYSQYIVWSIVSIGVIATLDSLGRLVAIVIYLRATGTHDGTPSAALTATTGFEVYISIIAASLPTIEPVYHRIFKHDPVRDDDAPIPQHHRRSASGKAATLKKSAHAYNVHALETAGRGYRDEDEERPLKRFDDVPTLVPAKSRGEFWTDIRGTRPPSSQMSIPVGGIRVQRDVTWEE